jgi:tetratricopeptide (TPR) repeat protein
MPAIGMPISGVVSPTPAQGTFHEVGSSACKRGLGASRHKSAHAAADTERGLAEKLVATTHANEDELADSHAKLGSVLRDEGDYTREEIEYQNSKDILTELVAQNPRNSKWQQQLANSRGSLGQVLSTLGDLTRALGETRAAVAMLTPLAAAAPDNVDLQRDLASARARWARH